MQHFARETGAVRYSLLPPRTLQRTGKASTQVHGGKHDVAKLQSLLVLLAKTINYREMSLCCAMEWLKLPSGAIPFLCAPLVAPRWPSGKVVFHPQYWRSVSDEAKDLINRMLTVDQVRSWFRAKQ